MTDSSTKRPRVQVYCLTYGEPAINDVANQFEYSLNILNRLTRRVAPIPKFVTPLLALRRGRIRAKMFTEMGYSSPLEQISIDQAALIAQELGALDPSRDYDVKVVMEFRKPMLATLLEELRKSPPDEVVLLPLYFAESDFTTGISRTDLQRFHEQHKGAHGLPSPLYVGGFGFEERVGKYMADFVLNYCREQGWSPERMKGAALMLGAHGTLVYPPPGINSGARETLFMFGMIRKHLLPHFATVRVGWLNHTLGGKWTFPSAEESGEEIHQQGYRDLVYFPFGFMGDNNESQNEGRQALENFEWNEAMYLPCPNSDPAFCRLLAEMTVEHLKRPERENWAAIEKGGRADLVRKTPPAVESTPGLLRFTSPTLGALSIAFWALIGTMLIVRSVLAAGKIESPLSLGLALFAAVLIGWFKGRAIFGNVVRKNLMRLRTLPQPSPLSRIFSATGYKVILIMMTFGISIGLGLKGLGWWGGYVGILGGVGLAMWLGALIGLRSLALARPEAVVSMDRIPVGFRKAG